MFRLGLIAITALVLITIWVIGLTSQQTNISLYMTPDVSIEFNPSPPPKMLSGIEGLNELKNQHETACIWLKGSLDLEASLVTQIKPEVDKQKGKIGNPTIVLDEKNQLKLKNYPIKLAIALLQNTPVTGGKLYATIIEPISPKASSCNVLPM